MRKTTRTIAAGFAAAAMFAAFAATSCETKDAKRPEFGIIEKRETVRAGRHSFELDYRFEYISWYGDDHVMREIQIAQIADFFGSEYVRTDPMESSTAFDQATMDYYGDNSAGDYGWDGFLKIRSFADVLNDRVVTFAVERSEYSGGAHGMETTVYKNYDLRTGKRLTLDDLFTPEGKAMLADGIRNAVLKDHGTENWDELMEQHCYFAAQEVAPTENFRLSENNITFVYDPYDIACYANGPTTVKLALNNLAGFKKEMIGK